MNRSNWIGAAIGLVVGSAATLWITNVSSTHAQPAGPPPRNATDDSGRFQIVMGEKHCFVLDTATGRVWQKSLIQGAIDDTKGFFDQKVAEKSIK